MGNHILDSFSQENLDKKKQWSYLVVLLPPLLFNIHDTGRGAVKTQNLVKISPGGMLFKKHLQKIMNRVYILSQGKQLLKSRQKTTISVT